MKCPVCTGELTDAEREGIPLKSCPDGDGVWLDSGELRHVVERVEVPCSHAGRGAAFAAGAPAFQPDSGAEPIRGCPCCTTSMEKVNYDETSGIMIDNCVEHGVWLDAGELERIEAWVGSNRAELAPVRERLEAEVAKNDAELTAAERAGRGRGILSTFFSFLHYARHSEGTSDSAHKNPPRT